MDRCRDLTSARNPKYLDILLYVLVGTVLSDSDNITPEVVLYFATMIRKAVRGNYNYQHKATWDRVQENDFLLPVTSDDQIDFNYMQDYIRAMEKQTIKSVVEYKDLVIEETKKVVNG